MEIILTRHEVETEEELSAVRSAFEQGERTDDMLLASVEEFKVGGAFVRIKTAGQWFNWTRRGLSTIIVDGAIYPLHGPEFARINCIKSQEELVEEKKRYAEGAAKAKEIAEKAYNELVESIDAKLEEKLDQLDREFTLQIG